MAYYGTTNPLGPSRATILVQEYLEKKMLKELGYSYDLNKLSCFDAEVARICDNKFATLSASDKRRAR